MTQWRPPRSRQERTSRSIRSMMSGSLDGRIVGAFPVKDGPGEEEFDDEDEEELDDLNLLPYTDSRTPDPKDFLYVPLTYSPWVNEDMPDAISNRSTVHLYWNNIFQRDLSYQLSSNLLIVDNTGGLFRAGDVLTAKYWYDEDNPITEEENVYQMECWLERVDIKDPNSPRVGTHGTLSTPPLGQNYGTITTVSNRYFSIQFIGRWTSGFRLPKEQEIPYDPSSYDYVWRMQFDLGASASVNTFLDWEYKGTDYGTITGQSIGCGLSDHAITGVYPPTVLSSAPSGPFTPTPGPKGGTIISTGSEASTLVFLANGTVGASGEHRSFYVDRSMPRYEPGSPYNPPCIVFGGQVDWSDTIYGSDSFDQATYNVTIGVTCYVVPKTTT